MSFIEKKNIRYKVRYLDFLRFEKGKSIFAAIINRKRFKLFGFFSMMPQNQYFLVNQMKHNTPVLI